MPEGIVGIIAGHLAETFECPTVVLTNTEMEDDKGNNIYKGSARSYGDFNIYEYLHVNRDKLFKFGGHPGAAGLSIADIHFEELSHISAEKAPASEVNLPITINIEPCDIPSYLNILEAYRPFGQGRLLPNFTMEIDLDNQRDLTKKYIGKAQEHIAIEGPFGKYKMLHFYHVEEKEEQRKFYMEGKISRSTFSGITTPTFIADICEEGHEHQKVISEMQNGR